MKINGLKIGWHQGKVLGIALALLQFTVPTAFGQAGALDASYQPSPNYDVGSVTLQPDGKALITGAFSVIDGLERPALARLDTNGAVDTSFVSPILPGSGSFIRALALQPNGKILIGGGLSFPGSLYKPLARLETNGLPDVTFNFTLDLFAVFGAIALQGDGKVLVITDSGLDRLRPDGSLDTNFQHLSPFQWITNTEGVTTAHNILACVTELGDGKILVGGSIAAIDGRAMGPAGLLRLDSTGAWDSSFLNYTNNGVGVFLVQPDGSIMAAGDGWLARLHPDGTVDERFGSPKIEGTVLTLARQPDGKILVGGYYQRAAGLLRPGIARFNLDGTLDRNFDAGVVDGFTVNSVTLQTNEEILIGGSFTRVNGQSRPRVARLHNDNTNSAGRFEFLSVSNSVAEAGGELSIPVVRYAGSAGTASVVVATDWGSAFPGEDYLSRTQTLVFLPDETTNYFKVPILDDSIVEGSDGWEAFSVQLSNPTAGAMLGSEYRASGYILEDDTAIGFQRSSVAFNEADGQAVINIVRLGVANATISASYRTENGTAVAPQDYSARLGTVTFAPGETSQTILVPLGDDDLVEGQESFTIQLSAPTGGASLAITNIVVFVVDDVSFMAFDSNPTVTETDGQAIIKVRRWGRTNNTVSIHYATSNLTALAGTDYIATSGTLTLLPGEVAGTISVPVLDDSESEDLEQFQVTLSEPAGTLEQPYFPTATVSIISNDGAGFPDTQFRPNVPGTRVNQIALAPGGAIVVRGEQSTLARYHPDGSMDSAFQPHLEMVNSITPSPDGKLYVGAGIGIYTSVRRLLADGQVDQTFDPFFVDFIGPGSPVHALVVQADAKVIVSASPAPYYAMESATNYLNRLNPDGSYDLAYGPVFRIGNDELATAPNALALQPDGKLLVGAMLKDANGVSYYRVVRLTESGQVDPTFSQPPEVSGSIQGIHLLSNGKLLIDGSFTAVNGAPRLGLAILEPNGALDTAFVPAFRPSEYFNNNVTAAAVQADGKILFCGDVLTNEKEYRLGRLNLDGSIDESFQSSSSFGVYLWDLALQADGKILLAGSSGPFFGAGLERLNNDAQAAAGELAFSRSSESVDETNHTVTVVIRRSGGTNGLARVRYATVERAATNGNDFIGQTGIVEFGPGDTNEQSITLSLLDDTLPEGDETFSIRLGSPVGGATWGENAAINITIRENDLAAPPLVNSFCDIDGQWKLSFRGSPTARYRVEASSDLIQWDEIGTASETSLGSYEFLDPGSVNRPYCFYRLLWP